MTCCRAFGVRPRESPPHTPKVSINFMAMVAAQAMLERTSSAETSALGVRPTMRSAERSVLVIISAKG